MTAQTMMEIRNQTRIPGSDPLDPETITTEALALAEIGRGMADGNTYAEPLDATIRSLLEMAVSYVMPRRGAEKGDQQAETNGLTVVVETSSERGQRDKYITVGGLKLWPNSEPPHTAFYAHHWVGPGKTFEAWRVEWDRFCGETTLLPRYQHRNDATERALRSWFAWVADLAKPEQFTAARITSATVPQATPKLRLHNCHNRSYHKRRISKHTASAETHPPSVPKKPFNLAEWAGLAKTPPTIDEQLIVDLTPEETIRLTELKVAWAGRSRPARNETSPAWQRTCERMLPLLALSKEEALDQFEVWRDAMSWAETTSAQYWAALRKAAFILDIPLSNFYKIQGRKRTSGDPQFRRNKPRSRPQRAH
jgi:hypothetical protein